MDFRDFSAAPSALTKVAPTGPITKANKSGQPQKMHDTKQMGFCFDGMRMRTANKVAAPKLGTNFMLFFLEYGI